VQFHGSRDAADRTGADTQLSNGLHGSLAQGPVRGEAEIVVGSQVDDLAAVKRAAGLLLAFQYAEFRGNTLGAQIL